LDRPLVNSVGTFRFGNDDSLRTEREARLLVGQTCETIAARCDVPAEVVAAYEALFLNVAGRLQQRDAVMIGVFGDPW
jgi:hypothetical protein